MDKIKNKLISRLAFTLAEVLITLGVIGVVAALTIPTLLENNEKKALVTQAKQTYAMLNNTLEMAKVDYGTDINQWYMPIDTTSAASTYFAQNYMIPYLKVTSQCGVSESTECIRLVKRLNNSVDFMSGTQNGYSFMLVNGTEVHVRCWDFTAAVNNVGGVRVQVHYDVNGVKKPNLYGKDVFIVELGGGYVFGPSPNKNKFIPYGWHNDSARTDYTNLDDTSCNKTGGKGERCLSLLMYDGWQIKDDYPW